MAAPLLPRLGRMAVRTATLPRATAPRNAVSHHEHVVGTLPSREVLSMVVFFVTRVILTICNGSGGRLVKIADLGQNYQ